MASEIEQNGRLLLVDDDPAILKCFTRVLTLAGFQVTTATTGVQALERMGKGTFDVVVTDISMPEMTGTEFLRKVRSLDLDVPVILVTGAPALETAMEAVEYGAFRYLAKPVEIEVLRDTARRAAKLHGLARLKRQALELFGDDTRMLGDQATLELRFAHALETLWMAWQPIVSWPEKTVFGFEALLRTGESTLMRPDHFIAAAERLHRLRELGQAIRRTVALSAGGAPRGANLFVNLHPADLSDEELYGAASPLTGVAGRVVLEITERAALRDVKDLEAKVGALRKLGFRIAVDDLGAGYAGLSSFAQLEPEVVKLDMSLVRAVDQHPTKQGVIRSMAALCKDLGMVVITEGIETPAERDTLETLGCHLLQGFLFARPDRDFPSPKW